MDSGAEISQKFLWSGDKNNSELLCMSFIGLFFKEGFTISKNSDSIFLFYII